MGRPRGSRNKRTPQDETMMGEIISSVRFTPLELKDPQLYLTARQLEYIKRLEMHVDEAHARGDYDIELKGLAFLVRVSPIFKTRVDTTASQLGLLKPPDLSGKTEAELKALESAIDIEGREVKEQ